MNPRIRALMDEAKLQAYYDAQQDHIEKFAELIVRECAHLVGGYTKENEFGTAYYNDVKEAYEEITKHFGVEE
jgi:hypothetical protein